jgi:hypothetical protein
MQKLALDGIGRLMATTSNDGVNSLAALHFSDIFGSSEVYQLVPAEHKKISKEEVSMHLRGRFLFGEGVDFTFLNDRFSKGSVIKKSKLTEEFDFTSFSALYGDDAVPLFLINEDRELTLFTRDKELMPKPGQTLLSLVDPNASKNSVPIDLIALGDKKKQAEEKAKADEGMTDE